jgi:hypothetical protein
MMAARCLNMNAWAPDLRSVGALGPKWPEWATDQHMQRMLPHLDFDDAPDLRDWRHPKVGWGVVLPDNDALPAADRWFPHETPARFQELFRERSGVTLRHRAELMPEKIRRYYQDGSAQDLPLRADNGIDKGELPVYLLILGSPDAIPSRDQYLMSGSHLVGRLDLPANALANYAEHLSCDWAGSECNARSPLVWSVDWGDDDITSLMREVLADPVHETYRGDAMLAPIQRTCRDATFAQFADAVTQSRPAMVVSTSHGRTSPLHDHAALRRAVGLPVDADRNTFDVQKLLTTWQPDGAIWYAHACCSAGTDHDTSYAGLFPPDSDVDRILNGVAAIESGVAPLPTALLSAAKPARAFIGHVEPTFDWPLQDPETGYPLSTALHDALTKKLYAKHRNPVALAFKDVHVKSAQRFQAWYHAKEAAMKEARAKDRERKREIALREQLGGLDWQGVVILGDPTVVLPPTKSA